MPTRSTTPNPFKTLGLPTSATAAEVKTAFRRCARATHPDRNPDTDGSAFRAVRDAYEAIRTDAGRERERRRYAPNVDTGRDLGKAASRRAPTWTKQVWTAPDPDVYPSARFVREGNTFTMDTGTPPPGWTPGDVPPPRASCVYHVNGSAEDRAAGQLEYGVWVVGILPVLFVFGPPPPST